jgi:3-hexulose-6-phosphate synthase
MIDNKLRNSKIHLQLALDLTDLSRALDICAEVADFVDIIEVGTPLIKAASVDAIVKLRTQFDAKAIVADMKTLDTGELDAKLAFDSGADGIIFQAVAPVQTIRNAVAESRRRNKTCMIDSLGITDMQKFERIVESTNADYAIVHTGIDEQREGYRPFERLKRVVANRRLRKLAVAGGIGSETIPAIADLLETGIVIVGASITKSPNPRKIVEELRLAIDKKGS